MSKETIAIRVPDDTFERFEEYRTEGEEISKADAGRRLLEYGLKCEEGELVMPAGSGDSPDRSDAGSPPEAGADDDGGGWLNSFLASFTAVMLGVAFVLVPSGDTLSGVAAFGLASVGAVGSGFTERRRLKPLAAPVVSLGRLIRALYPGSMAPYEPTTFIEWVATWDRHALTTFIMGAIWMGLAAAVIMLFGAGAIIATLGVSLSLLLIVLPFGLHALALLLQVIAIAAALAVTDPADDPTSTGEVAADE